MLKTYDVTLDIEKELYNPAIMAFSISQADLSIVELTITINQDDVILDLTDANSIQLGIKKPSGLVVYQDLEVIDARAGKVRAILTNQSYIEWGIYTAEVYIRDYDPTLDEDQVAVSCPFFYYSRSAVMSDDALESFNDWTALQNLLLGYDKKPILTDGIPTIPPEYAGQTAFDITGKRAFIAADITADSWTIIGGGGGGAGAISWADIIGKPATFPASPHTHLWADITDKPTAFFPLPHTHIWTDITDKPATFEPSPHTHPISQIIDLQATLDNKANVGEVATGSTDWVDITGKPASFPPDPHTHDFTTGVTGKPASYPSTWIDVSGKPATYPPSAHTHAWTEITAKPTTFAPSAHTHVWADLTDKPTEFRPQIMTGGQRGGAQVGNGLAMSGEYLFVKTISADGTRINATNNNVAIDRTVVDTWYALKAHTHLWADITDKPTTFVPSAHTHVWADLTDKPTTFAPSAHTHTEADLTFGGINAKTYVDNGDNAIINNFLTGHKLWTGTSAAYTAITTKDPNTLYFVSG
jgi:hypothetical protein